MLNQTRKTNQSEEENGQIKKQNEKYGKTKSKKKVNKMKKIVIKKMIK